MRLIGLLKAMGFLLFRVHHQSDRARGFREVATQLVGREADTRSISRLGRKVRAMFDDGLGRGVLARTTLFRETEKSVDFAAANVGGRLWLMLGLRLHSNQSRSRDVIDGIEDARGCGASVWRNDFLGADKQRFEERSPLRSLRRWRKRLQGVGSGVLGFGEGSERLESAVGGRGRCQE